MHPPLRYRVSLRGTQQARRIYPQISQITQMGASRRDPSFRTCENLRNLRTKIFAVFSARRFSPAGSTLRRRLLPAPFALAIGRGRQGFLQPGLNESHDPLIVFRSAAEQPGADFRKAQASLLGQAFDTRGHLGVQPYVHQYNILVPAAGSACWNCAIRRGFLRSVQPLVNGCDCFILGPRGVVEQEGRGPSFGMPEHGADVFYALRELFADVKVQPNVVGLFRSIHGGFRLSYFASQAAIV
jgi:hypothetical protein